MKATISGQAGVAVVNDEGTTFLFSIDSPDEPLPIHPGRIASMFRGVTDTFSTDIGARAVAMKILSAAWKRDRLLQMLLILLRRDADTQVRQMAAEAAEELIASKEARRFALNRLYSHPLTEDADIEGA